MSILTILKQTPEMMLCIIIRVEVLVEDIKRDALKDTRNIRKEGIQKKEIKSSKKVSLY